MNVLVTGATGFLGHALAVELHKLGHNVVATGRNIQKGLILVSKGITFEQGELSDAKRIEELCHGKDWVFHSGALSSVWGSREDFWRCNVQGTRNIVQGSLRKNVKRLIHISSPSIYFQFTNQEDIHEDTPLPPKFINTYTASKYAAEEEVMLGVKEKLESVILRPRAIYGPGDTSIFPRIVRSLESGRLPIIGNGKNKTDLSYIDNVVHACICAANASLPYSGRAYNITDGTPIELWPLIQHIAQELKLPKPRKKRSARMVRWAARGMEIIHRVVMPDKEPLLTEYGVGLLSCTCTLNIDRAKQELGYSPPVATSEGVEKFLEWWKKEHP